MFDYERLIFYSSTWKDIARLGEQSIKPPRYHGIQEKRGKWVTPFSGGRKVRECESLKKQKQNQINLFEFHCAPIQSHILFS